MNNDIYKWNNNILVITFCFSLFIFSLFLIFNFFGIHYCSSFFFNFSTHTHIFFTPTPNQDKIYKHIKNI